MSLFRARNRIFLAPMAGAGDSSFRRIAVEQGAGFTYTEMASVNGLEYGSKKTLGILSPADNENVFGVQLFGKDPDTIARAIETVYPFYPGRITVFDINMGCPAPKITGNGEGCALMKDPALASRIIKAAVKASPVPVSVKFRKGWDEGSVNAVDFARMAEDSGACALAVHGRTRSQFYSGKADTEIIAKVKSAVSVPVIGNGDIFGARDALLMFESTGCDAVMVARGALGNPFIFREINALIETGVEIPSASISEKADALLRQARYAVSQKGERPAMLQIRKHALWYLKGVKNAARIREAASKITTLNELESLLKRFVPS